MSESVAVGIDLGTTNSAVSVFRQGRLETIPIAGQDKTPSVVAFHEGKILVGDQAKALLQIFPEHTFASVKRFMGDREQFYDVDGKRYTPVDIQAEILAYLRKGASEYLGQEVRKAAITVPAYFNEDQREDTKAAAEKAGLEVLRLPAEPTAAAVYYGLTGGEKDQTLLVYDLGGGTFDVSILKVKGKEFEVIAVDGDSRLGGDDFDKAVIKRLSELHGNAGVIDGSDRAARHALRKLRDAAEDAKIKLASLESADIMIPELLGKPLKYTLTRKKFEGLIERLLDRTEHKVKEVLKAARLSKEDIDRVVVVGGSTKVPAVTRMLTERIKQPHRADNVDLAVSRGAAVIAYGEIEVADKVPQDLGIEMLASDYSSFFQPLIRKNTNYPCKGGKTGTTVQPYQREVLLEVFRNDTSKENRKGNLLLPIQPRNDLTPVIAIFDLDKDGIIDFTAVEMVLPEEAARAMSRSERKAAEKEVDAFFRAQAEKDDGCFKGDDPDKPFERIEEFIKKGWVRSQRVKVEKAVRD